MGTSAGIAGSQKSRRAVVVTPIYRPYLDEDDCRSLESVQANLGSYDHFAVIPRWLEGKCPGNFGSGRVVSYDSRYFKNPKSYNKLLFSEEFFSAFRNYDFMLLVQLDALVLSDRLEYWCDQGFDYIGAPWSDKYRNHAQVSSEKVGNGGFSLRNIEAALRVLRLRVRALPDYTLGPKPAWWHRRRLRRLLLLCGRMRVFLPDVSLEKFLKKHFLTNEDVFWGVYAKRFDPSFKVASETDALEFAFEADPENSFEKLGGRLPFGCHAWKKFGESFWKKALDSSFSSST